MMKDLFLFIIPFLRKSVIPLIFLVISTLISVVYPLFSKWAIDDILIRKSFDKLFFLSVIFLVLIFLQNLFSYLNDVYFFRFQKDSILDIQKKLLKRVFSFPMEFFDRQHSGYLMGRIKGDVAGLSFLFTQDLVLIFMDFFKFFIVLIILMNLNIKLTIISILLIPIVLLKIISSQTSLKKYNDIILRKRALIDKEISDTLQGIEVFKSFSKEDEGIKRIQDALSGCYKIEKERNKAFVKYYSIINFLSRIAEVLFFYFGIKEVELGNISVGGYIAFLGYLISLYNPIQKIGYGTNVIEYAKSSFKRVKELIDILPEFDGKETIEKIEKIEIRDLSFFYLNDKRVISNLSFNINAGDKVLIGGSSGSGKSTLIKLLLGLYRPVGGGVYYNGLNLQNIKISCIRERIGYISQNTFLFNKSIRDNLTLGDRYISDNDLMDILRICKLEKKIIEFDGRLDTIVSEKGINFSGGERQRLALARALIKNPDVIIIDEGTSNLDIETEKDILEILGNRYKNSIIIRITHRLGNENGWGKLCLEE